MIFWVAVTLMAGAALAAVVRIARGPTRGDRAVAGDLLAFSVIGLVALIGVRNESLGTLDLILAATLTAFLAAVSLARALTRGAA